MSKTALSNKSVEEETTPLHHEQEVATESASSTARTSPPATQMVAKRTAKLVYAIFMLHGIGTLMPWNLFLTIAPEYFINHKFMPTGKNATQPEFGKYFFSYLGVCSQLPNLLLNFMNLFIVSKANLPLRIRASLSVVALVCIFTIVFIAVDTTEWMFGFFLLTMFSVIVLNSANGIYQNSIFGVLSDFPKHFINSVIIGNNICGIFVSLLLIFTLIFSQNVIFVSTAYFSVALIVILACLFSFFWLPHIPYYAYHTTQAQQERAAASSIDDNRITLADYIDVFKQTKRQMLGIFLTFFVTLALFPAIVSAVGLYPNERKYDFWFPQRFYVPIVTFLNFNVFATVGNVIASYIQYPNMQNFIWPVVARLLFIPFFLFCNYGASRAYPVYITNELVFAVALSLMSLSHGYFSSLGMMYAPGAVDPSKGRIAGMMSAFFLVLGIAVGVAFTFVESYVFLAS